MSYVRLLHADPRARRFFAAHAQSSVGTGAAYVALLVVAYHRAHTAAAIAAVLLADFLPPALLGPLVGSIADRLSRRACMIVADLARAGAFLGIVFASSLPATVALALVAGIATALFTPASAALMTEIVDERELPTATSLFSALLNLGQTLGPVCASALIVPFGASAVLLANAATFALSALLCPAPRTPRPAPPGRSFLREAAAGVSLVARRGPARSVLMLSGTAVLCLGLLNVAELPLAVRTLHAGSAGFGVLVAAFGLGAVGGALAGTALAAGAGLAVAYASGLALIALGLAGAAGAPDVALAAASFLVAGTGQGIAVFGERRLLQSLTPADAFGRVVALSRSVVCAAFAASYLIAGGALAALGPRALFAAAALGVTAAACSATRLVRTAQPALGTA